MFRRSEPIDAAVWDKLMLGLSTRNYSQAVREFAASYGIEKSAVSDHFVRVSREKLGEILERPLDKLKLCVLYLDGMSSRANISSRRWESISTGRRRFRAAAGSERERDSGW